MDQDRKEAQQEEDIPEFVTPLKSWLYLAGTLSGIAALVAAMLYAWSKVL
jgi:hypothetical protein